MQSCMFTYMNGQCVNCCTDGCSTHKEGRYPLMKECSYGIRGIHYEEQLLLRSYTLLLPILVPILRLIAHSLPYCPFLFPFFISYLLFPHLFPSLPSCSLSLSLSLSLPLQTYTIPHCFHSAIMFTSKITMNHFKFTCH